MCKWAPIPWGVGTEKLPLPGDGGSFKGGGIWLLIPELETNSGFVKEQRKPMASPLGFSVIGTFLSSKKTCHVAGT